MTERLYTKKYTLSVEGETEKLYFGWLEKQINTDQTRTCNVSIEAKVQQSPRRFYRSLIAKTVSQAIHICDIESAEPVHIQKFQNILSEMKEAKLQKNINYLLGYSNFSFELWLILHRQDCNGSFIHRKQYLAPICNAFGEHFGTLDDYKQKDAFERCLNKLNLADVRAAVRRAEGITEFNRQSRKILQQYKGYSYYQDNPSLSIHLVIKKILGECGVN